MSERTHPAEEDLVLLHYDEGEGRARTRAHVRDCESCRAALAEIGSVLARVELPVPEPRADFERRLWQRLQPKLSRPRPLPRAAGWLALAASLLGAFLLGRASREPAGPAPAVVRERILLVAVGDHLERSQAILVELANGGAEVEPARQWADELLPANRLYRVTAARAGEAGVAGVLEELERVLIEIARGPAALSTQQLEQLRERIEAQGLLFRVRVLGAQVRQRQQAGIGGSLS